jgi:arylsulfatase A-like enzyme
MTTMPHPSLPLAVDAPSSKVGVLSPSTKPAHYRGAYLRLTDELGKAELVAPKMSDTGVTGLLNQHWRRHYCPFAGPGGDKGRFVQAVSLTVRRGEEKKHRDEKDDSKSPDEAKIAEMRYTQTFGLGEGSFDERESLVLPPPASVRYSVNLPQSATLRFSPAVLGEGSVTFIVSFRAAGAKTSQTLLSHTLEGPSKRWEDLQVELPSVAGAGQLVLSTETNSRAPAIGLWGSPVVLAPAATKLPYNVLFVIVDAMRGDAISVLHDPESDAKRTQAKWDPYDAWLPAVSEIAPVLNGLGARGIVWQNVWSAAMWTRPSTVAMLSGKWSSHLGLSVMDLELMATDRRRFYASRPPMLPRFFREAGANTAALVNNMYLSGSVGVGVDYAFETLVDHRYSALDTKYITNDALKYLTAHRDERFFLLLNYASPHSPHSPPAPHLNAVKHAPGIPKEPRVQAYLGEIHKDDAAIGQVLEKLAQLGLTEKTLVVVTADHGETMSEAHDMVAVDVAKGAPSGRFTHLSMMWDEAARVPMILSLKGKVPTGILVKDRVQTIDLLPTLLELEGLPIPDGLDGRSLVPTFLGTKLEERPIVVEGRGARSIEIDNYRLIVRERVAQRLRIGRKEFEKDVELYDLERDPGERKDVAREHPEVVERLRKRLESFMTRAPAGASTATGDVYHLRFALGGKRGSINARFFVRGSDVSKAKLNVTSNELDARAIRRNGEGDVSVSFESSGVDLTTLRVELIGEPVELGWELSFDGKPWPKDSFFGGVLGIRLADVTEGLSKHLQAASIESASLPHIASGHEFGLFVTREPADGPIEIEPSAQAELEAEQAMQAWGYARKAPKKAP